MVEFTAAQDNIFAQSMLLHPLQDQMQHNVKSPTNSAKTVLQDHHQCIILKKTLITRPSVPPKPVCNSITRPPLRNISKAKTAITRPSTINTVVPKSLITRPVSSLVPSDDELLSYLTAINSPHNVPPAATSPSVPSTPSTPMQPVSPHSSPSTTPCTSGTSSLTSSTCSSSQSSDEDTPSTSSRESKTSIDSTASDRQL